MALIQCLECGATISDKAENCPKCGVPIANNTSLRQQPAYQQVTPAQPSQTTARQDAPNVVLNFLSFFLAPFFGWILYFIYKSKYPIKAKSCANWSWIGLGAYFIFSRFLSSL